ncbi:Galectin-3-binding protein [Holothuria leucospilota]|uniref:Galectin-3-binding protein n=1 Tax=Holothuria leucospilota TaxID=206669 RepID=A0A9Q1H583_HOLLE|nr:Galectin-3-binding protein [Holothuria leucospilota]
MDYLEVKYDKILRSILVTLFCASFNKCEDGDIRLAGSVKSFEGRVEVEYNGTWGTICSNGWNHRDAEVVCNQLGFSNGAMLASNVGRTTLAPGSGPVLLSNLMCNGNERRLSACSGYHLQSNSSCDHSTDAVVVCQIPSYEGCYQEETPGWLKRNILRNGNMTLSFCISTCRRYGFSYARLGSGSVCHCGNNRTGFGSNRAISYCNMVCTGNLNEICGGNSTIYSYFATSLGSSSGTFEDSSGTIASPNFPGPYQAGSTGDWTIILNRLSPVNFTFDYIHLYFGDYIEIIPMPDGDKVVIDSMESQLAYELTSRIFQIRFRASDNTPPRYYGFLLHYQAPYLAPTTQRTTERTTTVSPTEGEGDCPKIGELFPDGSDSPTNTGTMLVYKDTLTCSGSLTMLRINCKIKQDFDLTLWRKDNSGKLCPVKSITIDITELIVDSGDFCTLRFGTDVQDMFLTRQEDRLSLDFTSFPFVSKPAGSSSVVPFVMMDKMSINGSSVSEFESRLNAESGIAISLEISFRKRDECQHEFRHTTLMSLYSTVLDGDVVDIVCDQYYHPNVTSATCLQGGLFDNQNYISCDRICPVSFGTTENPRLEYVMQTVSDELILNTGQPLPCRGSIAYINYYARPETIFTLSTWIPEDNGSYVLFDSYRVEGESTGSSDPGVMQRNLSGELTFFEGYILGISYSANSPLGFTSNSSSGGDISEYLVWNATDNEITEGRRLSISDAKEQQRAVFLRLTLKAVSRCYLDIPNSKNITSLNGPDVQGYIPDGFVQAGDEIQLTCSDGYIGNGEVFTCQETGSFDRIPECRTIVTSTTSIWILLIMSFVVLGVGFFGVLCLVFYWLCTIPEPHRKVDQIEEYILNRRASDEFPDSLPGDSEDGDFFDGVDRNAFEATVERNEYQGYPPVREEGSVPPPYDPNTDTFNNTLPAPRAVTFADESDNDIQADDDRSSPIPMTASPRSPPLHEGEQTVSPSSAGPPSVHISPPPVEDIPPPPLEDPPPPPIGSSASPPSVHTSPTPVEDAPPPPFEDGQPPPIGDGDDVPLVPLPPPPTEEA